jgi:hypothetical protein
MSRKENHSFLPEGYCGYPLYMIKLIRILIYSTPGEVTGGRSGPPRRIERRSR